MSKAVKLDDLPWMPVRPAHTHGIVGRTMLDSGTKMVYTRVEPGGEFAPHRDAYGHLFYIVSGTGIAAVAGREYPLEPGLIVEVEAGEEHYYRNTGTDALELISLNLPVCS